MASPISSEIFAKTNSDEADSLDHILEEQEILVQIAQTFQISQEKIHKLEPEKLRQRCFKKIIHAFEEENWELLNNIRETISQIKDSNGCTVFEILDNSNIPNFIKEPPETIIFQGGGPKGIAYIGALIALKLNEMLGEVKRYGGTSAGAITASLLAVGFTSEEALKIMSEKSLFSLLDFSISKGGLCKGEEFIEWLDKLIEEKTKIKFCTFGELKELERKDPIHFKHLHVIATKTGKEGEIVQFNSEDKQWKNLIISEAVRASMSLPVVFKPHVICFKDPVTGNRIPKPELGIFMDGGLSGRLFNLPLEMFDKKKYTDRHCTAFEATLPSFNKRLLAFSLYTPGEEMPKENQPAVNILEAYKQWGFSRQNAVDYFRRFNAYNSFRVVKISNTGVHTFLGFTEGKEKLTELVESGKAATLAFLKDHEMRNERFESFKSGNVVKHYPPKTTAFYMTYQSGLRESFLLGVEIIGEKVSFHTDYRLSLSPLTSHFKPHFSFSVLSKHDARFLIFSHLMNNNLDEAEQIFKENARFFSNCFEWIIFRKLLIESNHPSIIEFFLRKFSEGDGENRTDFNPLIHACKTGAHKSLSVFIRNKKSDLKSRENESNKTILYYLAKAGNLELITEFCDVFKRFHSDSYQEMLKAKVKSDSGIEKTAYCIALEKGHNKVAEFIFHEMEQTENVQPVYLSEEEALQLLKFGPLAQDSLRRATISEAGLGILGGIASVTIVGLEIGVHLFQEVHNNIRKNKAAKFEILYLDDHRFKLFVCLGQGKMKDAEIEYQINSQFLNALMETYAFRKELQECLNNCDVYSDNVSNNRYAWYVSFLYEKGVISAEFIDQLSPRYILVKSEEDEEVYKPWE